MTVLREEARRLTKADGVTVVLRDGDQCHYVEENAIAPLWKGRRFPMTDCISGWCMLHREQVAIPDIYADPRIPHDAYRPTFVKSLAMTPIRSEAPIGARRRRRSCRSCRTSALPLPWPSPTSS